MEFDSWVQFAQKEPEERIPEVLTTCRVLPSIPRISKPGHLFSLPFLDSVFSWGVLSCLLRNKVFSAFGVLFSLFLTHMFTCVVSRVGLRKCCGVSLKKEKTPIFMDEEIISICLEILQYFFSTTLRFKDSTLRFKSPIGL